jgi:phosphonate transport system ATP-binding protein
MGISARCRLTCAADLNPTVAEDVMSLLHGICKSDGLTAVVSLRDVSLARKYAD